MDCYLRAIELLRDDIEEHNRYPFSLPVIRNLERLEFHPKVTFLIGENGSGKSTLIEAIAIACGFNPEGGTRNFNFASCETHSELHQVIRLIRGATRPRDGFFLRAETFYNVATQIDEIGVTEHYGGKSLHYQSHGEAFFATVMERFGGRGLYILDEPEAALSPMRQLALLSRMKDLVDQQSQFIIATHSPIIMGYPDARILQVTDNGIETVEYESTEHYTVTKEFLNNRGKMLKLLME